jgi:arylsulfatase A-like enzyme
VPGQASRVDIHAPTSSVDVLPTLPHLADLDIPDWCEGQILPGLGGDDLEKATFIIEEKANPAFASLRNATIAMRKGKHKLICCIGYGEEHSYQLYDHEFDLEEMNDLYPQQPAFAKTMREELFDTLSEINRRYQS